MKVRRLVTRAARRAPSLRCERSEATKRIDDLLAGVVNGGGRHLPRVREVWVFGSYSRRALEVGDIDVAVEFDQMDDEAGRWFVTLMAGGYEHLGALRRDLRGNQRALEIHFNELEDLRKEGFEPRLLWRRGDSLEVAHARLAALVPNASARQALRDTVHPLLADVEKLIPRPARQEFSLFMWGGLARRQARRLPLAQVANAVTRRRFRDQWLESNPRFRAAHAVASYLEREGVAPLSAGGTVYSDEREILDAERDYWPAARRCPLWRQVAPVGDVRLRAGNTARPRRLEPDRTKQPLPRLDMWATVDRERLAAAYRVGDLPDYMLEFVDSLRTRATPATS